MAFHSEAHMKHVQIQRWSVIEQSSQYIPIATYIAKTFFSRNGLQVIAP